MASTIHNKELLLQQAIEIAANHYNLNVTGKALPGEIDDNFYLVTSTGEAFVLKFTHPDTSYQQVVFQTELLNHLQHKLPNLVLPKVIPTKSAESIWLYEGRMVRLLEWIPGRPWASVNPKTTQLREQLGHYCGKLSYALQDFDHPEAHRFIKWDVAQVEWITDHLDVFKDPQQRAMVDYCLQVIRNTTSAYGDEWRKSVIQNDLNDYNILLSEHALEPHITSFIDYGDAVYTYTIAELAIACTYALMEIPDPLEGLTEIVAAYHQVYPLNEAEMRGLFSCILARLLISVTASALNKEAFPENEYLLISEKPAWALLTNLYQCAPSLVHYAIRKTCGLEPFPQRKAFDDWLASTKRPFAPVVPVNFEKETYAHLDLSVESSGLGNYENIVQDDLFERQINRLLSEHQVRVGVGGYGETRALYTTDNYLVPGNDGPKWRTVHLGLDIWMPAFTPVYCPYEGVVYAVHDNKGARNYGPTVILQHQTSSGMDFYSLYGHLSDSCLSKLKPGQIVNKWEQIAEIGPYPVNGGWPPHLHFQIILDPSVVQTGTLQGPIRDFPGVAFPNEKAIWLSICPDPGLFLGLTKVQSGSLSGEGILERRKRVIGPNLSISYQDHLHMVRGQGVYLYDKNGQRYLDMVNNVAHVGHEHPKVVEAGQKQMGVLNTNSRYLHENLVLYAEELLATLPPSLEVCYFVNAGSEANELALRMAHTITGSREMLAVDVGYHGHTTGTIDVSSYKFDGKGGSGAPQQTHTIPLPDTFRGLYRNPETAGAQYAQHAQKIIDALAMNGKSIAGFIGESILSCGGQIVLPPNYLKTVFEIVRRAGGLCIVDEVQVGFGRVGSHFWGFELQEVVPDIVTMGKPIGNGHPLGAVVTTRAVADAFANGMEFFSTFGGNPVSCAIGRAVLDVIEEEALQENALRVGHYLREQVRSLQVDSPLIADVRGEGLFIGIELIDDLDRMMPATHAAKYLVNRMRHRGILLSTDGPDENVIKIKPPICFKSEHVDFFLGNLQTVLKEDYLKR